MTRALSNFASQRAKFHRDLLERVLFIDASGVASNADGSNRLSCSIARGVAKRLESETRRERAAGQTAGSKFEEICANFVGQTFAKLAHLRPGRWQVSQVGGRNRLAIAEYQQYAHLTALDRAAKSDPELAAALGSDYTITPDIIVVRGREPDAGINSRELLVDGHVTLLSDLRVRSGGLSLLHASVSCKWTIRSDRAQNARSEALNLIRNRKGRLPHIVVVTAEPLPSRIASIALGTGDIDCVYHFALYELQETLEALGQEDALELLVTMIDGGRLKDISDLPLDLAV